MEEQSDQIFQAEFIKEKRVRKGKLEYLIKWKDFSEEENTWEPEENILDQGLVSNFENQSSDSD